MPSVEEIAEKILYWLSSDLQVRALAERLLHRFAETVGDLPASERHHHAEPGGLHRHSLEVAEKALEEFEGNIVMEHRSDSTVDSFRSSRNRPRWQYATFIGALCHDLGKVFDLEVRGKAETWSPIHERYCDFGRRVKTPMASWDPDREHGEHAERSAWLLHHVLSPEDIAYLGKPRVEHLYRCLEEGHSKGMTGLLSEMVKQADQASVEQAQPAIAARHDSKVGLLIQTWQELMRDGQMWINTLGAQVWVEGERTAVIVPVSVSMARDRLKERNLVLPPNANLYNQLRSAGLVESNQRGLNVWNIRVQGKHGPVPLSALIFPTEKVVPTEIVPTLPATHFEIEIEPKAEAAAVGQE